MIGWMWRRAKRVWQKIHPRPANMPAVFSVRVREIEPSDLDGIIDLLTAGFWRNPRSYWVGIMQRLSMHRTPEGFPKYGYMLENDGAPVGVLLMIFSARTVNGVTTLWGNESSYYVEPLFRFYASLLVRRAHRYKDVTYLDLTASIHTWTTLAAQGYKRIAEGVFFSVPAFCRSLPRCRIREVNGAFLDDRLDQSESDLLVAHANYGRCISVICEHDDAVYPFVFAVHRRYGIAFAFLVYSRNQTDFVRFAGALGRFLIKRRIPVVVLDADSRIGDLPGRHSAQGFKYWLGKEAPRRGDLAYTEIAMFG
jgi:hypothetical protein